MAMLDYGVILKVNGVITNRNKGIFMDMKEAVGFELDSATYKSEWEGEVHTRIEPIKDNYFAYFGDEQLLFCVYRSMICIVDENNECFFTYMDYRKKVIHIDLPHGVKLTIKRINDSDKLHAKVQYKGINYEVIYGYGIDNNINTFRKISRIQRGVYSYKHNDYIHRVRKQGYQYGYDAKIARYIKKFLK